ncbi:hypothetical protein L9F63_014073, partial [Diploptera punctata]
LMHVDNLSFILLESTPKYENTQITIAAWAITYANDREAARRARREGYDEDMHLEDFLLNFRINYYFYIS